MKLDLVKLQQMDRRILYILLFVVVTLPFFVPFKLLIFITPEVKSFYRAVEEAPKDKIVIVAVDWDAATLPENWPQTEATIEHLMRRDLKFAILALTIQGPEFGERIAKELAQKYNKKYGIDWCNWGYKLSLGGAFLEAIAKNIPRAIKKDIYGTPISQVPMLRNVRNIKDVSLIAEFTGSGVLRDYIRGIQGPFGTTLIHGCTAVVAPENYIYLNSGQLTGMLTGMKGAAEYEKLLASPGKGSKGMNSQSLAHMLVIVLIILGNMGFLMVRKQRKPSRE